MASRARRHRPTSTPDLPRGSGTAGAAPVLTLPDGLAGFAGAREYRLVPLQQADGGLMLLRSLDQPELGFVILPVADGADLYPLHEQLANCRQLGIAAEDLLLMLVVTMRPCGDGNAATANIRAPLFVDTRRRLGWQVVLHDGRYSTRSPLQLLH